MQVQLTFRRMNPTYEIENHVFKEAEKIGRVCPQSVTWCHVVIEKPHSHKQEGRNGSVRVSLQGVAGYFVASSDYGPETARECIHSAISEAFQAARSQLRTRASAREKLLSWRRGRPRQGAHPWT